MTHTCHTVGCDVEIPPKMLMCKRHWYELPREDRDLVWSLYEPGQEITKTPSAEYIREVFKIIARQAERLGLVAPMIICDGCMEYKQYRATLDGDSLCQECADKWTKGEGVDGRNA